MALLSVPSKYENDRKMLRALFKEIVKSLRVVLSILSLSVPGLKSGLPKFASGSSQMSNLCWEELFTISNKEKNNWNSDQFFTRRRYIIPFLGLCLGRSLRDLIFGWKQWVILPTRKLRIFRGFSVIKK